MTRACCFMGVESCLTRWKVLFIIQQVFNTSWTILRYLKICRLISSKNHRQKTNEVLIAKYFGNRIEWCLGDSMFVTRIQIFLHFTESIDNLSSIKKKFWSLQKVSGFSSINNKSAQHFVDYQKKQTRVKVNGTMTSHRLFMWRQLMWFNECLPKWSFISWFGFTLNTGGSIRFQLKNF